MAPCRLTGAEISELQSMWSDPKLTEIEVGRRRELAIADLVPPPQAYQDPLMAYSDGGTKQRRHSTPS